MSPDNYRGDRRSEVKGRQGSRTDHRAEQPTLDTTKIRLSMVEGECLPPELFDSTAEYVAKVIAGEKGARGSKGNKPTQIRRFYDEVVMWEEKIRHDRDRFKEYLPFIRMLNAKVAYARGRDHVDDNFVKLVNHCISQVGSEADMRNFKLFFEAFMGFYKVFAPKG